MKVALGVSVAVVVAFLAGWATGASGKTDMNHALQTCELRDTLVTARAALLEARLDIYSVNFGEASRHFEAARGGLRAARERLNRLGRSKEAQQLEVAFTRIDEAQRMAGQLNQDANSRAADAAKTINDVLQNGGKP